MKKYKAYRWIKLLCFCMNCFKRITIIDSIVKIHTIKKSLEKEVCSIQQFVFPWIVELVQNIERVHHANGVVNEKSIVVFPQMQRTLSDQSVLFYYTWSKNTPSNQAIFCRGFGMYNSKVVVAMTSNLLSLVPPHQLHIPVCPYPAGYGSPLMAWTRESLTSLTSSGHQMDPVDTNKTYTDFGHWTFKRLGSREWHYDWGAVWKRTENSTRGLFSTMSYCFLGLGTTFLSAGV